MTISLCMIVKNEQDVIERCLKCGEKIADEIIIVDTGSYDNTKEICYKYTNKVYDFDWCDDFSQARNYAFSKATKEYIIWLDADDIIDTENINKILELKNSTIKKSVDVYMLKYATSFDKAGNILFYYYRERIIKNCNLAFWQGRVHEVIVPFGTIEYFEIVIEHRKNYDNLDLEYSNRNLRIYRNMIFENCKFSARDNYYYARELFFHRYYNEALEFFEKVIKDESSWIENKIDSYIISAKCYYILNDIDNFLKYLMIGNTIDTPRSEFCCKLGEYFLKINNITQAIFWFKSALNCEKKQNSGAFIEADYYYYIPCLNLCVCLDKIGKFEEAFEYNKKAGDFKKDSEAVIFNNIYFNSKLKGSEF